MELLSRELNLFCAMRASPAPIVDSPVATMSVSKTEGAGVDEWSAMSSLSEQAHKLSTGPTLGSYSSYTPLVAASIPHN